MPYGFVKIFIYFLFLFSRRQGFQMIIFDRQAGLFQNFNRSQVVVIGRSISFSNPRDSFNTVLSHLDKCEERWHHRPKYNRVWFLFTVETLHIQSLYNC